MLRAVLLWIAPLAALLEGSGLNATASSAALYGLNERPPSKPYLNMPSQEGGALPQLLSQTGAFENTRDLRPGRGLIPYDIIFPFWSDGASKLRWAAVPDEAALGGARIGFTTNREWVFPAGTVFVKHFELATDETRPEIRRRLETRLLVRDERGGVYGATYKWRADNSDADLLPTNLSETILIKTATGIRTQIWYYPSRQDCQTCHTERAGRVLGVTTRQMNRQFTYPGGTSDNQLRAWNHIGLFAPDLDAKALATFPRLAAPQDSKRSLEDRVRSYLDANCAHCHRPGGTVAFFDARYDTPLPRQDLIEGPVRFDQGIDRARAIAPNDPWRSLALLRVESSAGDKMPPLAHNVLDRQGAVLLREWIGSLEGRQVLPPPEFEPIGGKFAAPIELEIHHPEPGVTIHYTLDGTVPTSADPVYSGPIKLTEPVTVRAKAFKPGYTRSITAQQTFQIGE